MVFCSSFFNFFYLSCNSKSSEFRMNESIKCAKIIKKFTIFLYYITSYNQTQRKMQKNKKKKEKHIKNNESKILVFLFSDDDYQ
jgi:hypothetical protein